MKIAQIKPIIFILFLTVISFSCNHKTPVYLQQANEVVYSNPDSALSILYQTVFPSKLKDYDKAEYWRIRSLAHNLKRTAMINDSFILFSLDYYKSGNDTAKITETSLLASEYYTWVEKKDSAINILTEGLKYAETTKDTALISTFLHKIAYTCLEKKEYEKATGIYKKIIAIAPNPFSYYILALHDNDRDSVDYYRDKSIELALQKGDTLSASHYLRNYASVLYMDKKYHKAEEFIQQIEKISPKYASTDLNYLLLSQINIALGNIDFAQEYLDKALELSKNNRGEASLNQIATENIYFILQSLIDTKKGKTVDISSISAFNDSIISSIVRRNRILDEQQTEKENLEKRNLHLAISKYRVQTTFAVSVLILVIIIIFLYLYVLKRKRKFGEIRERTETLQKLYRDALSVKDIKENNSLLFRNTLLQQLGIMRLIAGSTVPRSQELLHQIVDISNETVSTESLLVWKDLYSIIDSVYDNFYTSLLKKYGNLLIEKEIQLCCLLCADFSTIEISTIMQQSMQTIYQRKSSVRKKFNMDEKEDIVLFLKEKIQ